MAKKNNNPWEDFITEMETDKTSSTDSSKDSSSFSSDSSSSLSEQSSDSFGSSSDWKSDSSSSSFDSSSSSFGSSYDSSSSSFGSGSSFDSSSSFSSNYDSSFSTTDIRNDDFDSSPIRFDRDQNLQAQNKLSFEEAGLRLDDLNKDAETKHYVFVFGAPNSGKTFMIANIINFMNVGAQGTVRLHPRASDDARTLFSRFVQSYDSPYDSTARLGRTGTRDFFEIPVLFEPTNPKLPTVELTFLDASGENFERAYKSHEGVDDKFVGQLPDSISIILRSKVNKHFLFLYDPMNKSNHNRDNQKRAPQAMVLQALFNIVREYKDFDYYPNDRLLVITKSDEIPEQVKADYNNDSRQWLEDANASHNSLSLAGFAKNFFAEKDRSNLSIFYSAGKVQGQTFEPSLYTASKVFSWIYTNITGKKLVAEQPSFFRRVKKWLSG
ncbi:hypothetical protein [Psittacicella hinzii]|uniref:Uncharacterized protein n=1 Tax=Psittacicella hinzii TaxID=2028575 RepID=A0A3A1YIK8_9GAMM|nr:hypothetical protein [Psittacicella hinzii]RIY37431.1 hypothetical protein CKF58_05075 [Psittacicella hinzii]